VLRLWIWLAPAIAIAASAIVAGAVVEGIAHAARAAVIVVGAGEVCRLGVPAIAAAIALGHAIWRGWRPVIDDRSAALIVAGLGFAALATAAVFGAGYGAMRTGVAATKLGWLAASIGGAGAAAAALLAFAAARPAVRGGAWVVARVWPGITPRRALIAVAIALAAVTLVGWIAARPLLARYDLGLAAFGGGALGGGVVAAVSVVRWPRARTQIAAGALVVAAVASIAARVIGGREPTVLIDAWSQLPVSGRAIEARHQIAALREVVLAAIPAPVAQTERHPDILLITIDALRADRLGAQQPDGRSLTPAFDALASEGAVFERAFAPSTVTRGSLPPILTQLSPGRLRGRLVDYALKLDPRHVLFAEKLQRAGYATRGYLCCAQHFGGAFEIGLDRGLDQVIYNPEGEHLAHAASEFFADAALDGRPRFAWLHTYEPHLWSARYPWTLYGAAPAPRYDRTVATVDRVLAPLLAAIRARGRPTIVVVTADHGEGLGDHGVVNHAGAPYASQIQVPLVISGPAIAPRRIPTTIGLVGLGDTLLELAGFSPPPSDGPSFAHLLSAAPHAGPGEAYSAVFRDRVIPFTAHSLVVGDHHLIEVDGRPPELYDLRSDPREQVDLATREPALLAELRRRLADHRARDRVPAF